MNPLSSVSNLFKNKLEVVIFVGYMGLFVNQGILVTATKTSSNQYEYNTTLAVLLAEFLKLIVATFLFTKDESLQGLIDGIKKNKQVMLLYMIPSFMYCLYNNLAFVNLKAYDPTTYYLLLQFRVVVTGVVFQILFKKKLSWIQWFSLFFLTTGCIVKQITPGSSTLKLDLNFNLVLILLQVFCSCFAGVYNEYLLKGKGGDTPFMLQNVFMYIDSVACNIMLLSLTGNVKDVFTMDSFYSITNIKVLCIIANNAAIGIVTALFLRSLNSILKTFASALELMFTAVLCWFLFDIPVTIYTALAIFIVTIAVVLYAQNPIDNTPKDDKKGSPI